MKRGFEFTLMVVGETGLGKSTLINSMFLTDIYSEAHPGPSLRLKKTVQVETSKVLLREGAGVNLTLTIVDTPGFGDAVDNSSCWEPVLHYVESQYEAFLEAETQVHLIGFLGINLYILLPRWQETQTWLIVGSTLVFILLHRQAMVCFQSHCCVDFQHIYNVYSGLKPLDIEFMKQLHDKINIIPVIGKADTMTPEEVEIIFFPKNTGVTKSHL